MELFDIAILGTGPAGLEAAITASIRNKKIVLFGNPELSQKVVKAHLIQNYLGFPAISGSELRDCMRNHLEQLKIPIVDEKVMMVYPMGDYFSLATSNSTYQAKTIILATGVSMDKTYPGETEFLGRGVSYCATCDAALYRNKVVAMIGFDSKEEAEVNFMSELANKVYYFPMYKQEINVSSDVEVLKDNPTEIRGTTTVEELITSQTNYKVDGVFVLRESISPTQLVPGLEMDGPHVAVDRSMKTNLPGCFACGDIVGKPYQYIKAAGEGNVAALSAVIYLDSKR